MSSSIRSRAMLPFDPVCRPLQAESHPISPWGGQSKSPPAPFLPALACPGTSGAGPRSGEARPKVSFCSSPKQADRPGRGRPTVSPQAGHVLAGQMIQYPLNHRRIFDGGDDLHATAAARAGFNINLEDPLEALRPAYRRALLSRYAVFGLGWLCGLRTPGAMRRRDPGPMEVIGCEYPMKTSQIQARRGTRAARRAMKSSGSKITCVVPSRYGVFSV